MNGFEAKYILQFGGLLGDGRVQSTLFKLCAFSNLAGDEDSCFLVGESSADVGRRCFCGEFATKPSACILESNDFNTS